jgi:enoyl-CoA hydratase/carnithine racemase
MYRHLRLNLRPDGCAEVTLDRPPANSADFEMLEELTTMALGFGRDTPRVVTLASAHRIFMAGADLGAVELSAARLSPFNLAFQAATNAWAAIPCPTIAAINGHALGGGCELTLACDWRIMARGRARIGFPEVQRGLLAAGGGTQRAARLLGAARAKDLLMRGRLLDADEAYQIGLVSEACDAGKLPDSVDALVQELLALPAHAVRASKRCVDEGLETTLFAGLMIERREVLALADTADAAEGVRAFLEKREPVWTQG